MEQITSGLGVLAAAAPVLMAGAVWMSPEALTWLVMRLRMRIAYIQAGRDAADVERKRFEVTA
jgi:hypothetical protein